MSALYFYAKNGYNIKCDCGSAKRGTIRYQKKIKVRGETMYTCAKCNVLACGSQDPAVREKMPKNTRQTRLTGVFWEFLEDKAGVVRQST